MNRMMKLSVLLVDDTPSTMIITRDLLGSLPMDVFIIVAMNGVKGLESFKNYSPELVLSDIGMSDMDGFQMLKEIRRLDRNVPVILMSGYTKYDMEEMKAAGMTEFLPKPFDRDQLLMSIDAALAKQPKS